MPLEKSKIHLLNTIFKAEVVPATSCSSLTTENSKLSSSETKLIPSMYIVRSGSDVAYNTLRGILYRKTETEE